MLDCHGCQEAAAIAKGGPQTLTTRRTKALAAGLTLVLLLASTPAHAAPTSSSKRAQATKVRSQVQALDDQVEAATENYNEAASRYAAVNAKAASASSRLKKVSARLDQLEVRLGTRAVHMYRSGPLSFVEVLLGATDFDEFATVWDLLTEMNRDDARMVAEMKTARAEASSAKADLDASKRQAAAELASMKATKKRIESQLSQRKKLLSGIEAEVARLEAEEDARAAAAARASSSRRKTWRFEDVGGNPPASGRGDQVVWWAKKYLGVPYVWAGASPSGFDCSGFTMYVYKKVGVSLPHSSRAQINCGARVSRNNLQPGDLVFFGSPIHHVGIYVGGGMFIHAPRTGDVVKISSLSARSNYSGACRP